MSPRSTFHSCGSSSRRVRRRKRPIGVTRGSSVLRPHRRRCAASASLRIDRNLWTVNDAAVLADALLVVEHRARRRQLDRQRDQQPSAARRAAGRRRRSDDVERALGGRQRRASCGSPPRRSASSDAGSRRRSCRCTPRRPTPGGRSCTPSSFISSSLSIGSLPRASARLTTTRSTRRVRGRCGGMSSTVPMTPGSRRRPAIAAGSGIDEADELDAELVRRSDSSRASCDRRAARADDQQPLARPDVGRQPLERHAPAGSAAARTSTPAMRNTPRPMTSAGTQ